MNSLFLRALLAFLALPGMVAFVVPLLLITPASGTWDCARRDTDRWSRASAAATYVGVLLILCGWAIGLQSGALALYAVAVAVAVHLRVVLHEEPFLARTHPEAWAAYRGRVRRWIGW